MENIENMDWEEMTPITESESEMKQIQRSLRRRNWKIVLTSLVLAAAILLAAVYIVIPAAESLYWDPNTNTYNCLYSNDLELALEAYGEVFCPQLRIADVTATRTGFATYDLTISHWDGAKGGRANYTYATLTRGELKIPEGFFKQTSANIFERGSYPYFYLDEENRQDQREKLESLPDYIRVEAAVSFPEDMDMEQLIEFIREWNEGYVLWIGVRNAPEDQQLYPLTGMAPFMGGYLREGINEYYPCFNLTTVDATSEDLEQHFVSLLTYLNDQEEAGRAVGYTNGIDYYENVLDYIEENGVHTYGCMILGPAEMFLEMLDSGVASQIWIQDAWIDV